MDTVHTIEVNELPVDLPLGTDPNTKSADAIIERIKSLRSHPWYAIESGLIWTLDSARLSDPAGVIKKLPPEPWMREITELWLKSSLFACPKSRRMKMSWHAIWWHLWLTMFYPGAHVYCQSLNEDKADEEIIQRAGFIYNNIPAVAFPKPRLKNDKISFCNISFPKLYSFMKGIPQGANQLRGPTASAVLLDEAAFWEKGRESFGATKPCTEGGGRVTLISSAQLGWYRDVCFDQID